MAPSEAQVPEELNRKKGKHNKLIIYKYTNTHTHTCIRMYIRMCFSENRNLFLENWHVLTMIYVTNRGGSCLGLFEKWNSPLTGRFTTPFHWRGKCLTHFFILEWREWSLATWEALLLGFSLSSQRAAEMGRDNKFSLPPPQTLRYGPKWLYTLSHPEAWLSPFMTHDWNPSNVTDSAGQGSVGTKCNTLTRLLEPILFLNLSKDIIREFSYFPFLSSIVVGSSWSQDPWKVGHV